MTTTKAFLSLALLGALEGVHGFWRMECRGLAGLTRIDPLVSPGTASQHVHTIQGSDKFSETATYADIRSSNCTSCAVSIDNSNYWTPALYFLDATTNEFEVTPQVGGMLSYYLLRNLASTPVNSNVTGFPAGFRMISGNTLRRNYTLGDVSQPDPPQSEWASLGQTDQNSLAQRAIGFNCLDYSKTAEGSLFRHFLPTKSYLDANCPDGLRLEVAFPSCWDGVNVDSADHMSHVAYPDLVQDGNCPSSHPVRIVTLFYETIWNTAAFTGRSGSFVISNGDPTGFGYHGDFMMGWDPAQLQTAVDSCTSLSGTLDDCHFFDPYRQSLAQMDSCSITLPENLKSENTTGPGLSALPGNVAIQSGPEQATLGPNTASAVSPANSYSAPSLGYSAGTSGVGKGGIFIAKTSDAAATTTAGQPAAAVVATSSPTPAVDTSAVVAAPATTEAPVAASAPGVSYSIVSTQTITKEGGQVEEIVWEEPVVFTTEDITTTITMPAAEKKRRRSHHHQLHNRHHGGRL